jgi:hypothetical protein
MQLRAHCSTHAIYTYTLPESYCGSETNLSNRKTTRFVDVFMYTYTHADWKKILEKRPLRTLQTKIVVYLYIHIIGDRCMFIIPKRVEIDADGFPFGKCYSLGCAFYQTEIYGDTYVINRKERILQYLCS